MRKWTEVTFLNLYACFLVYVALQVKYVLQVLLCFSIFFVKKHDCLSLQSFRLTGIIWEEYLIASYIYFQACLSTFKLAFLLKLLPCCFLIRVTEGRRSNHLSSPGIFHTKFSKSLASLVRYSSSKTIDCSLAIQWGVSANFF